MNNTTAVQEFGASVAGLLFSSIFPAIVKGLKDNKGIDITSEELSKWCNLPISRSLMPAMGFGGATPSPVTSTANTSATAAKKKAGVKAEVKLLLNPDGSPQTSTGKPYIEGKSCRHFYEKGIVNAGKYCGKDVIKGTFYCGNKTHKDKENKQKVNPGVSPAVEIIEEEEEDGGLNVVMYHKERNLLRETTHNFIVQQEKEDDPVFCLGKLYPDNTIRPLTDNEKVIARALDLTIPDTDLNDFVTESKTTSSTVQMPTSVQQESPTAQQIPTSVPQMPIKVPQMPTSVPQMPKSVPQMPLPKSVPQMPLPMSVPQMPRSVPQFPGSAPK